MKTSNLSYFLMAAMLVVSVPVFAGGPGEIAFDEDSMSVLEESGMVTVVVERSRGEDGSVTIDYSSSAGTATEGADYSEVSGTLSWGPNDGTNRSFSVPILDDADAEGVETIDLALSNPTGGAIIRAGRGSSVIRIQASDGGTGGGGGNDDDDDSDDDSDNGGGGGDAGVLKFDQRNFVALEGVGVALVTVERSQGEDGAVTVDYSTAPGSAAAGDDYQPASGTLSWGPNDGSLRSFMVTVIDDDVAEGSETVNLSLSNATGGATVSIERGTAVLTILDDAGDGGGGPPNNDDEPGTFKFDMRNYQVIEGAAQIVIGVERSQGDLGAVSVEYATVDGSATAGDDYQGASGVLSWGSGDGSTKTFTVTVFDDALDEGNETLDLVLSNPTGGALLDPVRFTAPLTILDNDGATACVPSATTQCLLGGRFRVEAVWRTDQGTTGSGRKIDVSDNSSLMWFFDESNAEVLVKVLDACALPGFESYWVFFAATTNVDFTMKVTDTASGVVKEYSNPFGQAAVPVQDTFSFETCP